MVVTSKAIRIRYTNYKGVTANRHVTPINLWYGSTPYHREKQWLLTAYDHGKSATRDFALADLSVIETKVLED